MMLVEANNRTALEGLSWLDRPLLGLRFLSWERVCFATILGLAVALRFWDLGWRILHHDESIHAVWSWYLYSGRGYRHDPVYHGPFLYHFQAFIYFLIGATDYAARVGPAIFGAFLVALPWLLRRQLGRTGALATSFLLAISPSVLYYSRSLRHDIFSAVGTVALVVAMWRYMDDRRPRWLYIAAGSLAITFTNHELSFITAAILGAYLFVTLGLDALKSHTWRITAPLQARAEYLLLIITIVAPLGSAMMLAVLHPFGVDYHGQTADLIVYATLAVGLLASFAIGIWWNRPVWLRVAAIFWVAFVVLFTSIFSNPEGFLSGTVGGLRYWLTQQSFARGGQPWYYYLLLFPLYDFLPLAFGVGGVIWTIIRRNPFGIFLVYWSAISFLAYSWAGEKMPWLVIHISIPFCFLAGMCLGRLVTSVDWRALWRLGGLFFGVSLLLLFTVFVALSNRGGPTVTALPLQQQQRLFTWLALFLVWSGLVIATFYLGRRLGVRGAAQAGALTLLAILLLFTIRSSLQVNFKYGDTPVEMLVYTQSSPDVGKVMREIDRVAFRLGMGKDIKVAYDDKVSWPFEWYLRDYTGKQYYGNMMPANDAPIVLVGLEGDSDARVRAALGSRYIGQQYKLRWWFPEDYKSPGEWLRAMQSDEARSRPGLAVPPNPSFLDIAKASISPAGITRLWRYFLYRETFSPLGSTDFMLYIRKDLVDGLWAITATKGAVVDDDQYLSRLRSISATQIIGSPGSGDGQFLEPKGVAIGPDSSIYVADARNNRIQKLDPGGRFVSRWGTPGNGPGQFAEPWGLAVDRQGNVYVADTWNHRIQKFDKDGKHLSVWGTGVISTNPGEFYGPRSVAVDSAGNVFVSDTGNHRIQKFDSDGRLIALYGSRGSAPGQFSEPVGLALDWGGTLYVADTWNHRIQKLDASLKPIDQWPVVGWQSQSLTNKPYLAVGTDGMVYGTDPDGYRVLVFGGDGNLVAVWGKQGTDASSMNLPTGIAVDLQNNVWVSDSMNSRLLKFSPIK
jgi:uncharacterized protein (TIGR03663 family)